MRLWATVVLGLAAATANVCGSSLLVLSKHDHTLAVVDPETLKVLGRAPIGPDPHEVIASADGSTAYVSNYGFGAYHTIAVVDLKSIKTLTPIDLGPLAGPHGLTFVAGKLWFTAEGAKVIGRYDPASGKVDWVLGTGQDRTHMIYVTPDAKRIYTTNVSSGTVSIIDKTARPPMAGPPPGAQSPNGGAPPPPPPQQRRGPTGPPGGFWDQRLVEVGVSSEGFDITPDGRQLWAADAQTGDVSVVDLEKARLIETLKVGAKGANRLKFTPDGKQVLISSLSNTGLIILDAASHKEVKRIPTPRGAAGIEMDPDGSRAFVSCTGSGVVDVVDLKTLAVKGTIDAGPEPDGLAWVAGGR